MKHLPECLCPKCGTTFSNSEISKPGEKELICPECGFSFSNLTFTEKISDILQKSKPKVKRIAKYVLIIGGVATVIYYLYCRSKVTDIEESTDDIDDIGDEICDSDESESASLVHEPEPKRYEVLRRAFSDGKWYTKTRTNSKRSACSVAKYSHGRACKIIDTETGDIIYSQDEDASMAACNGYPDGYQ